MSTAVFGAHGFKARSGRVVKPQEDGSVRFGLARGYLDRDTAMDAEEYFQAKRDADLKRWRVPQDPHLVVYQSPAGVAFVFDEKAGDYSSFARAEAFAIDGLAYRRAARAYFEAHPVRKPWEDAKDGEVWVLTGAGGLEQPWRRSGNSWFSCLRKDHAYDAVAAIAGRRIWPEDAS